MRFQFHTSNLYSLTLTLEYIYRKNKHSPPSKTPPVSIIATPAATAITGRTSPGVFNNDSKMTKTVKEERVN